MTTQTPPNPEYGGRSFYGYDSDEVQQGYSRRAADGVADFLMPLLKPRMRVLDCGCGPGAITVGFAQATAPSRVVGIDIEPTMIEKANALAADSGANNLEFRVANIYDLPFESGEFDVVFSSAVTEHLSDPVRAIREMRRVTRTDGMTAIIKTDWSFPFIVPQCPEFSRFFELFEGGFNRIGGSLNRGRYLRSYMMEAGLDVTYFDARIGDVVGADAVASAVEGYITWMDNVPLFRESIELGITTESELDSMRAAMRAWAKLPDAYIATASARAIGTKRES